MLQPARQREIERVGDALVAWGPDKVFVERQPYFWQRPFDSTYALYRAGTWPLPRNEIYQLGYRVAKRLGHPRVYAGDHAGFWLGDSARRVAAQLGQTAIPEGRAPRTIRAAHEVFDDDRALAEGASIVDVLALINDREYLQRAVQLLRPLGARRQRLRRGRTGPGGRVIPAQHQDLPDHHRSAHV